MPPYVLSAFLVGQPLLYFVLIFVSLGVFIFGFDQGLMSGLITNEYFKLYFDHPLPAAIGTMVAILEIGALVSLLGAGRVGDKFGRRRTIRYGAFVFVIGGTIQTTLTLIGYLLVGRLVSGFGVGLLLTIVPVFQLEISPPHNRGKLACMEFTGNIVGYALSIWVDYAFSFVEHDGAWRYPLSIQVVMGSLLFVGLYFIVETPRWLLDHDHDAEGIVVIADLVADGDINDERAKTEFRSIKENVLLSRLDGERLYTYMFKRYRKRVVLAMGLQMFAQLNGINIISYYAPMVFELAGWVGRDAILMTGFNSIVYVLSTVPPWYLVDAWGRRRLLLIGAVAMGLPLCAIAVALAVNALVTPTLVVVFVVIYNAAFGFLWGPLPWLYPPEILPLLVRSKGTSLSTASNWAFNWLVGEMTPILQELIQWRMYLIPAALCFLSFAAVFVMFPETKGLHLEDMDLVFDDLLSVFSWHSSGRRTSTYGAVDAATGREPLARVPSLVPSNTSVLGKDVEPPLLNDVLAFQQRSGRAESVRSMFSRGEEEPVAGSSRV